MNRLDAATRTQVIRCLCEGASIRSSVRITGVAKNTVVKLLVEIGSACARYQDKELRNLPCQRLQADEIWAFVYAKQRNVTTEIAEKQVAGDVCVSKRVSKNAPRHWIFHHLSPLECGWAHVATHVTIAQSSFVLLGSFGDIRDVVAFHLNNSLPVIRALYQEIACQRAEGRLALHVGVPHRHGYRNLFTFVPNEFGVAPATRHGTFVLRTHPADYTPHCDPFRWGTDSTALALARQL